VMFGGKRFGLLCIIQLSISILSRDPALSIQFGGLVPGWNLVLVCWERETVSRQVDDKLVAVWADSFGALVTASVAATATATTTAATTTIAATPTASTTISFSHSR
jgi:hypothetical protein